MDQWGKVFWEGGRRFVRTFRVVEEGQKKYMEAGFVDVHVKDFKVGRFGRYLLARGARY